jgi:hypothetical protein
MNIEEIRTPMQLSQLIKTKYLPATGTKGARIKVTGPKGSKTYPYSYEAESAHWYAAWQYANMVLCEELIGPVFNSDEDQHYFLATFTPTPSKSSIVRQYAESAGLPCVDVRLDSASPSDVSGLPTKTVEN